MNVNTPVVQDYLEQISNAERDCNGDSAAFSRWSKAASLSLKRAAKTSGSSALYRYQAFRFAMRAYLQFEREKVRADQDRKAVLFHG